ncbi:MAG: zinc ribbon domain-containing protein [Oscillospiraceae bacterium]|nr:zinc ribbon domain-containing protein [Oscillospiraceae bacterium]
MFCSHCGAKNADNSAFCENCGANISADAPIKPRKPLSRRTLIIICAAVAAAIIALTVVLIIVNQPKTLEMDNYISVSFEGFDTVGRATLTVDGEKLVNDLTDGLDESGVTDLYKLLRQGKLDVELEKESGLRNGDTVTVNLTVDNAAFEEFGLKIKLKKTAYTVEGLKPITTVDPFDYLKVTVSGYEPYASVDFENTATDEYLQSRLYFYCDDRTYDCSNGDELVIYAGGIYEDSAEDGYHFTRFSMTYTLTDVPQPEEIDVFDILTVTYSGVDGEGRLSFEKNPGEDDFLSNVSFSFDKTYNLTSGDVVTCTASYWKTPEEYGYKVLTTEKTFTVPQLGTFVTDYTVLGEEARTQLTQKAQEKLEEALNAEYVAGSLYTSNSIFSTTYALDEYESFENVQLTHVYTYSGSSWSSTYHTLGFVFSVDLLGHPTEAANGTAYFYLSIEDLILLIDGTLEPGWEDELSMNSGAYVSFELLKEKRLNYYEDLVVIEQ